MNEDVVDVARSNNEAPVFVDQSSSLTMHAEMVSGGTLYVFLVVCLAVIYRRYKVQNNGRPCLMLLLVLVGLSIGALEEQSSCLIG